MKKLSITTCLLAALSFCVCVPSVFAKGKPAQMPVTLLDLYRQSDAVFEARFDKTREGEVVREDEDYTVVRVQKIFDVSSTLKGSFSKFFVLTEDEYRYARPQGPNYLIASSRRQDEAGEVESTYGLRSGDTVLLFLKFGEDGKTLELTDDDEGLKKLNADELAAYERRIRELDPLLSSPNPSADAIVEWMMRCAEEPATRWEATFELVKGFERLDWQKKQAEKDAAKSGTIVTDRAEFFDSTTFAKALTDEQKHRLADILLGEKQPTVSANGDAKRTLVRGDRELIDLIKQWGDPRLARFLIDELKTNDMTDYRRSETMRLIADMLGDQKVLGLADRYNNAYLSEAIAAQEMFSDQQTANGSNSVNTSKPDYKQRRAAIMTRFLKLADSAVAAGPDAEN